MEQSKNEDTGVSSLQEKIDSAVSFFGKYQSCCTGVFAAYAPEFGIEEELAARLTIGMPGIGCSGNVCGAVSAAALVISLKTKNTNNIDDWESTQ